MTIPEREIDPPLGWMDDEWPIPDEWEVFYDDAYIDEMYEADEETYFDRLRLYEAEKKRLWMECTTTAEYEQKIKELARKCGI